MLLCIFTAMGKAGSQPRRCRWMKTCQQINKHVAAFTHACFLSSPLMQMAERKRRSLVTSSSHISDDRKDMKQLLGARAVIKKF